MRTILCNITVLKSLTEWQHLGQHKAALLLVFLAYNSSNTPSLSPFTFNLGVAGVLCSRRINTQNAKTSTM